MTGPAVFRQVSGRIEKAGVREILEAAPLLAAAIPELAPMVGFDQRSPHHGYDLFTHTAHVVAAVPEDLTLRWAALLHDVGKIPCYTTDENGRGHFYGHAQTGARLAGGILRRMDAPEALCQDAVFLIENHMIWLPTEEAGLTAALEAMGHRRAQMLIFLQEADMGSKGLPMDEKNRRYFRILHGALSRSR